MNDLNFDLDFSLSQSTGAVDPLDPATTYDVIIVGGGPAAMTAAVYAARKMLRTGIIAGEMGGQMSWTSEIGNYTGFQAIGGVELTRKFEEHVNAFEIPVTKGVKVQHIHSVVGEHGGDGHGEGAGRRLFVLRADDGSEYRARTVLLAMGKRERPLDVPGERELRGRGVAYCAICDAPFYKGRQVVVVGGGNSAIGAAIDLARVASRVLVLNTAKGWQADPILLKSIETFPNVELMDRHQLKAIKGDTQVTGVELINLETSESRSMDMDGVFVEVGLIPNTEPVADLVELNKNGEIVVDCNCHTSMEGVFAAGDVTSVPYKQIIIAAGEGAKAALSAYDYLLANGLVDY